MDNIGCRYTYGGGPQNMLFSAYNFPPSLGDSYSGDLCWEIAVGGANHTRLACLLRELWLGVSLAFEVCEDCRNTLSCIKVMRVRRLRD